MSPLPQAVQDQQAYHALVRDEKATFWLTAEDTRGNRGDIEDEHDRRLTQVKRRFNRPVARPTFTRKHGHAGLASASLQVAEPDVLVIAFTPAYHLHGQ